MTNFTARIAGVATLALAVLPVAALSTAHAATHAPVSVRVSDIDLSTADGRSTLVARTQAAAHRYCESEFSLDQKAACEAGVRSEVAEKARAEIRLASRN
jgi:UrcA family protein